mmetsp:Transcript_31329/g.73049  ORF Transcript_31329/g.73049 Transcript_31329/m.73049 type:complete len:249 (-) Transcript_31329:57-803(-)
MMRNSQRGRSTPQRSNGSSLLVITFACIAVSTLWAVFSPMAFSLPTTGATAGAKPGRRSVLQNFGIAAVQAAWLTPNPAGAGEPLPPPVEKNVAMTAAKLAKGVDELYFDIRPAIKAKRFEDAQQFLGQSAGAYIPPIDNDLFFPLQQILDDNLDAEEDGWTAAYQGARKAFDNMKTQVNKEEWKGALKSWDDIRSNVNTIFVDINDRCSKPYLPVLDDAYFDREDAYRQAKRDAINYRNAVGTLALR